MRSSVLLAALVFAAGCGGSSGPPIGPPAPVRDTIRVYTGHVSYFTTGPNLSQHDAAGRLLAQTGFVVPTLPRTGSRFAIEILDSFGSLLAEGQLDDQGNYSITINYGKNPAPAVTISLVARLNIPGGSVARVFRNAGAAQPYRKDMPLPVDPGVETVTTNITVQLNEGSAAFHILDFMYEGLVAINQGVTAPLPDLDIFWEPGNGAQSSFTKNGSHGQIVVAGGITGDNTSNTDAWDAPVIARLLGEYFLGFFSNDVSPAGTADDTLLVPSLAWREGFLDFFSCVARGDDEYWDTEGQGAAGHVVRYFHLEKIFDPALGSLGPDDPNVYHNGTGLGSRHSVAEVLWDIYDGVGGDNDTIEFPLYLTLRCLETIKPGSSYPYLHTLLDDYVATLSLTAVQLDVLLMLPEDHQLHYPATVANGLYWPVPFASDPSQPKLPEFPGFDQTLSDQIDTSDPALNPEVGFLAQRYFTIRLAQAATLEATITSGAGLRVEILDMANNLLVGGNDGATAPNTPAQRYVIRVVSAGAPVQTAFDLRVRLLASAP